MTIVWAGLSVGAVYALLAIGFNITMTFGGTFNFAQGILFILGTFFAWWIITEHGLPWWVAVIVGGVLGALIAAVEELIAVRPVLRRKNTNAILVTTVGATVLIEGLLFATWGEHPQHVQFFLGEDAFSLLGGRLTPVDVALVVLTILFGVGLQQFAKRSLWGVAARGATSDPDYARVRGINVDRLRMVSFALAGAMAGALGPFIGPKAGVSVETAITLTIFGFVALAVGGFGSFTGSMIGGLVVGVVQAVSSRYLGVDYPPLVLFALLLLVLLIRPTGLFGQRGLRVV